MAITKMSLKEVGDSFFNEHVEKFIIEQPFLSFVILSSMIEFMGKCYKCRKDFHESGHSKEDYYDAINNLQFLQKYIVFNYGDTKDKCNHMYKWLRCGMLHAFLPKEGIKLASGNNDLNNKIVGAKELYTDIKNAWDEIKKDSDILNYINNTTAIIVYDNTSGQTASDSSSISGGTPYNN